MGARERMSAVDTAWFRMDSDTNLMMIVGVYEFDRHLDVAHLRKLLQSRLVSHRRFRSRVVRDATGCYWQEADDFKLDNHLVRVRLPGRGTEANLKKLVGKLASQPLASLEFGVRQVYMRAVVVCLEIRERHGAVSVQ